MAFHGTAISPVTAAEMRELHFSRRRVMLVWISAMARSVVLEMRRHSVAMADCSACGGTAIGMAEVYS